ncbi:MAG: SDR family oxidoreductase [Bryobacteraceae bacterium]
MIPQQDSTAPERIVLVTGAASGLGEACATALAAAGVRLVLPVRRREAAQERFADPRHIVVDCDVSQEESVQNLVGLLRTEKIVLNGVVLAAGTQDIRPLSFETKATLQATWEVNVYGSLGLLAGLLKARRIAKESSIVLFSSAATQAGGIGLVSYAASKGALEGATRSLAMELASQRIRVNAIAPGVVETPMSGRYMGRMSAPQIEAVRASHPLGFGVPQDIASLVTFLVSDTAKWITGTVITIDGGLTSHS